jgi:hypothetical protein
MEQEERIFSRDEANQMLPRLRPLLAELRGEWLRIQELNPEIQKLREKISMDAYSPHGVEYVELVSRLTLLMEQIRDLGVFVKDVDKGLCDFPYRMKDRIVYLCWQVGEDSIEYWHDIEAGFAGREPLRDEDC